MTEKPDPFADALNAKPTIPTLSAQVVVPNEGIEEDIDQLAHTPKNTSQQLSMADKNQSLPNDNDSLGEAVEDIQKQQKWNGHNKSLQRELEALSCASDRMGYAPVPYAALQAPAARLAMQVPSSACLEVGMTC